MKEYHTITTCDIHVVLASDAMGLAPDHNPTEFKMRCPRFQGGWELRTELYTFAVPLEHVNFYASTEGEPPRVDRRIYCVGCYAPLENNPGVIRRQHR